tara:strand:- start:29443 stop:29877 length:435 start_codon:yes stop_codon:yes gene_type:complete
MSRLLVFLQFLFILLIGYPSFLPNISYLSILSIGLFLSGIVIFFIALITMRRHTFTVFPEPKAGGRLITSGIYGYVRHPMYLAVTLCALGASLFFGLWWKWILTGLLLFLFWLKICREEKMLLTCYSQYALYKRTTKAIIPFIL